MRVRTWIEIDSAALRHNAEQFLRLVPPETHLMAVVKSNAYGHGLTLIAKQLANFQFLISNFQKRLWFGVDSITEAIPLRKSGIKTPILVLGSTLSNRLNEAARKKITVTTSNFEQLKALAAEKTRPAFHIKIDSGMHRQGFISAAIPELLQTLKSLRLKPEGIYTHFAAAGSLSYKDRAYTQKQFKLFEEIVHEFQAAGFENLIRHAANTGATLLYPDSHFDMVRIGIGLYGYSPTEKRIGVKLKPVLSWKTLISEIKEIPKDSYVGYDYTEKVRYKTKIAVLPIGYWHGYDRRLSGKGEVLIRGRQAKVLGRVSMDMIVVDVTNVPKIKVGDEVVLLGKSEKEKITASEIEQKTSIIPYEFLTRLNPLILRIPT